MEGVIYTRNNLAAVIGEGRDIDAISAANPLFAEVTIYDVAEEMRTPQDEVGYAAGVAAIVEVDAMFAHMDMLQVESFRTISSMIEPEKDSRLVVPLNMLSVSVLDSTVKLRSAYQTLLSKRKAGSYRIFGRLFEGAGFGAAAAAMPGSEVEWDLKDAKLQDNTEVDTMSKAVRWLLENHPDYYMGAIIEGQVNGMRRRIIPAPARAPQVTPKDGRKGYQNDYAPGDFEDYVKRRRYVRRQAVGMGLKLGPKEYEAVWSRLCSAAAEGDDEDEEN